MYRSVCLGLFAFYSTIGLVGCTSNPTSKPQEPTHNRAYTKDHTPIGNIEETHSVIRIANKLKGKPYRYGGLTPQGFDCSGLVHYAYRKAGIHIPRTTQEQYRLSQLLTVDQARPGDLLFFRIVSRKLSHVGLYAGNGRFIHASTSKKIVSDASIYDPYWRDRLIAVGRIY